MREVMIIVNRELRERVSSRAFLVGTFSLPIFMVAIMVLPGLIGGQGEEKRLAVVDEAPAGIGDAFAGLLVAPPESDDDYRYEVERVPGSFDQARADLHARVQAEEIDGYVVLPADMLEASRVVYRARNIANMRMLRDVSRAASRAAQGERLRRAGLEGGELAELLRNVTVDQAQITATGEQGRDAQSTFWVAYIVAFVIYLMVALYGSAVTRSVLEEKTNRIAEVLMSSVRAQNLMLGKILGVGGAAVLQVIIWAALIALLVTQSARIAELAGITPEGLAAISIAPGAAVLLIAYFTLGFFLYAALFAALGAAMTTDQETQSFTMVLMIPLFLPLIMLFALTNDPLGGIATTLGLIPFTAPIAMPIRIATTAIPGSQIALSLILLVLSLAALAWLAGKIYRIGILSTGRRASISDIVRWLRTA